VLLYTLGVSLLTGMVFGLAPALNCLRVNLTPALKTEGLQAAGRQGRMWLQNTLIGVQVAGCVVLLASAALLLRGLQSALRFDVGFASENILIANMDFRQQQYTPEKAGGVLNTLRDTLSTLPGVNTASATGLNPIVSESYNQGHVIGPDGNAGPGFMVNVTESDPHFFATIKIPMVQGRTFTSGEYAAPIKVAIIDDTFAKKHFKEGAIGKRIRLGDPTSGDVEIIGVAADTHSLAIDKRVAPRVYTPLAGLRFVESRLLVNYSGPTIEIIRAVERAVAGLDPALTVRAHGIEDNISEALMPVKMAAAAAGALAALALILACTGLYGVVAFAVSRRRREMGIRLALGAARRDVLRMVLRQGLTPVFAGAIVGVALAAAAAQLIRAMLYGISPIDPVAFGGTLLVLGCVATLAALVPARAALSVDPAVTLRHD
jgi:predicted permease